MKKNFKKQPTKTTRAKPSRVSARNGRPCPIVGIGASSGGLEAFSQLLRQLPADTGFGFVLVQHLDPQHQSALAGILARTTTMPVRQVTNNLRVEANNVYIIPPNTSLGIEDGVLKLLPRQNNRLAPRSIDQFFESLAKDQAERAIGVILSGNATDGTLGLEAIKAGGGFTFAQDKSARYDSMPRSAAAAGCVDRVLSPAKIASELARIAKHPYLSPKPVKNGKRNAGPGNSSSAENPWLQAKPLETAKAERFESGESDSEVESEKIQEQRGYNEVLRLLRNHSGVDFSLYKSSTVSRRIARRSVLNRQPSLQAYASFLRGNTKELGALYSDALIGVTSFFRNPASFAALKQTVFPKLLAEGGHEPIRVWVLGCSTGQEAYSLAIAYIESAEKYPKARKLQIFATDLNEANLEKARIGFYPKTLGQDVSSERLQRFFVEDENGYRVGKQLRELIVFARQNVMSDPPFSRMDLISCRNLMIYLEPSLQKKIIPMFHYALKKGGFLFLGASESVGGFGELFDTVSKKNKIFVRKMAPTRAFQIPVKQDSRERFTRTMNSAPPQVSAAGQGGSKDSLLSELNAEREADRVTVSQFAPPGVLIDSDFQVLQFRGRTGAYLEAPTGKATFDLLRMAREGLMLPLRAAINSAKKDNKTARREGIHLKHNGRTRTVGIKVVPLKNLKERCFLVLFEESGPEVEDLGNGNSKHSNGDLGGGGRNGVSEDSSQVAGLERDLSETRDYLHSVQENQEAANDELQATNEEGQSANEELQSLNEELETSKEELESTNEELTTVNEEMVSRNSELNRLIEGRKKDEEALRKSEERFRALFELGPVAVYTCDNAGRLVEYNKCARELWGRTPKTGESGARYCGALKLLYPDGSHMLHSKCPMAMVLSGKMSEARDVEAMIERPDGSQINIVVNIVPLKNELGETTGAINCFYDVTERKRAEIALGQVREQLSKYVGKLETLVVARTANLSEANQKLLASNNETSKSREEYRALFADSLVMQEKLRHVTRLTMSAQEDERKKISRELHDQVVQTLIGIGIELTALRNAGLSDERLQSKVGDIEQLVRDTVTAVHGFARGLRPAVLDDLGLVPALHLICKGLRAKKKLKIQISSYGAVEEMKSEGRIVLFRIAQEALTNVSRHANASQVLISVGKLGHVIRLEIADNGKSFAAEKMLSDKNPKRLGLIGMRERLEMVGGTLNIESAKGKGTIVRAEIPVVLQNYPDETSG